MCRTTQGFDHIEKRKTIESRQVDDQPFLVLRIADQGVFSIGSINKVQGKRHNPIAGRIELVCLSYDLREISLTPVAEVDLLLLSCQQQAVH